MALSPDPNRPRVRVKAVGRPLDASKETMALGGEMLKSGQFVRNGGVWFLPIDDILTRKGFAAYREMGHDDQIKVCMEFKKILIHGRTWDIKAKDDSEAAEEVAKFVSYNLKRINFRDVLKQMLTAFDYGFSVAEILWEVGEYEGKRAILLKNLKPRDPDGIEINMDKHGNVLGFRQADFNVDAELPISKVWHFVHNGRFGNPYGTSDLRAAYRSWWAKKFVINFWSVFLERMGTPMTLMKYPHGASQELKDALKSILTSLSSKTEVLVPEGVEVELVEATRSGNATYNDALMFHNNSIARALLMIAVLGAGGDDVRNAADSQSQIHLRATFKLADDTTNNLSWTLMHQVIKQLVVMNFEKGEELMPELLWQDYGQFEGVKVADTIRLLHAAGIIDMDQDDVNYARSVLGLPLRGEDDEEDEVVRPQPLPPPADPNKPPPAAGQGNERAKKGGDAGPGGTKKASEEVDPEIIKLSSQVDDLRRDIAALAVREPSQVNVHPTINVAAQPQAAPAQVTVNVPENPTTVNVTTPEVKVDLAAPVVHVGAPIVNLPEPHSTKKEFAYDTAGNIISSTETVL